MGQPNGERCTSTGTIKGCGRRALWDRHGKPVVVLYAIAESDGERVWTCADCIARAGVTVPDTVPARCRCMCPGCERPRSSATNYWRLCGADCHEKLRKIVDDREAERALASGVLALDPPRGSRSLNETYRKEPREEIAQTDGAVQEEVADQHQTVPVNGGESVIQRSVRLRGGAAYLVLERAAKWAERAAKWHARLERERAWSAHGRVLSVLTGAASTISAATVAPHYAAGIVGALMVATALIAWRGQVAQARLDSARLADAWVSAERIAELYRGLVVELEAASAHGRDGAKWRAETFAKSQQLEAKARFGVPEDVRAALVEAAK